MKQGILKKALRSEAPVWCEQCRLRIAPYEEAAIDGSQAFHKHCFQKVEMKEVMDGRPETPGLDLALA